MLSIYNILSLHMDFISLLFTLLCIIDSAVIYCNEEDIGLALEAFLPKYNLNRDDVFITSKLCKYGIIKADPFIIIY